VAWGAIDLNGQIRAHGKLMVNVGLEPWLGHFLITAQSFDCLSAAIYLAAHLSSQEPLQYNPFHQRSARNFKPAVIAEAQKLAQRFNQPHVLQFEPITESALIHALADRLVHQLESERAILISGTEVRSKAHFKAGQWWLLLDGIRSGRQILASAWLAVSTEAVLAQRPIQERTEFDPRLGPKPFRKIRAVGQIRLSTQPCTPSREEKISAWMAYIESHGEQAFTWSKAAALLRQRWLLLSGNQASWLSWPKQDQWLALSLPFLAGLGQLHELSMVALLNQYMGYANQQTLSRLCPEHWCAPSGRNVPLTYDPVHGQIQAQLKLQEAFGLATAPTIPAGVPIRLALTAPNGRPVAVVTDWSHFWLNIYPQIRKELRGRYAKHPWPDDPLTFKATAKTARQIRNPS
jgi:ATP-dependent helicase HrpB